MFRGLIYLICLSLTPAAARAFPEAPFNALENAVHQKETGIPGFSEEYDFEGIVRLSSCSASLVRFIGQPKSSPAYVLTNGHCIGRFPAPGTAIVNRSQRRDRRSMVIYDGQGGQVRVRATRLIYATMTSTDAALYEIDRTYADLEKEDIEAFTMAAEAPMIGTDIEIVSGYWNRGFSCSIEFVVFQLLEGGFEFDNSLRYSESGCEVYGGTSGSPITAAGERTVVGVNNTGNESGRECTMNNPCEVDQDGQVTVIQGRGYGQQTALFYNCLTPDFQLDLDREGCELPQ